MNWDFGKSYWEVGKLEVEVVMDWMFFELWDFSLGDLVKDIFKVITDGVFGVVIILIFLSLLF